MKRDDLMAWLDKTLEPWRFSDYCPNGLQVEGKAEVTRIVTGVTASLALIEKAIELKADAILVHHGWFWRGENLAVTGTRKQRLASVLAHDLNLIAFHLPLDAHPTYGNNMQLGQVLGLEPERDAGGQIVTGGSKDLVWFGRPDQPQITLSELSDRIGSRLSRAPIVVGDLDKVCARVAWCTGGAQGMFEAAIEAGADAYITGEISEPNAHLARESGVAFISAGHHATERYGAKALGEAIAQRFDVEVLFLDIDNPA